MIHEETWAKVPERFGPYEVSSLGRIRNAKTGRVRKGAYDNGIGYQRVLLSNNGKLVSAYVHRLVATAFCEGDSSLEVNHRDGNKSNNCCSNLEWVTKQQNMDHAFESGLAVRYKKAS